MKRWLKPHIVVPAARVGFLLFLGGWMWRAITMPLPEVTKSVEILYRPPNPEFIETFRLQCVWVER